MTDNEYRLHMELLGQTLANIAAIDAYMKNKIEISDLYKQIDETRGSLNVAIRALEEIFGTTIIGIRTRGTVDTYESVKSRAFAALNDIKLINPRLYQP